MTSLNAQAGPSRMGWIDFLRGLAVLLVVSTHAVSILIGAEKLPQVTGDRLLEINRLFWPFRMAVLVLLSGLFVDRSYAKGLPGYLLRRVRYVLWPYVIWSFLMIFRGAGWDPATMVSIIWRPYSTLWFLYYLFAFYVLYLVVRKIPAPLVAAASLVASFVVPSVATMPRFLYLFAFFMIGCWLSQNLSVALGILRRPIVIALTFVPTAIAAWAASQGLLPLYDLRVAPFALAGLAFAIGAAQWLRPGILYSLFAYVGRHSIIYYVTHPLILIYLVMLMSALDVPTSSWWYPIALASYVIAATLISLVSDRVGAVHALFVMPVFTRKNWRRSPMSAKQQTAQR
ncbi:acyltransferase family protein [Salinibacterium sp. M195]|uniref:acyltransferase family protein n=1 Tax=Salinibacterium sp. M195 TaxID=2583374 RepID=UPI001C632CC0|nr:acyltransferase family protein [Salinibacterium sp. M195]QYH34487.1 hypothetical protein FFT87_00070 [Salinibacterium sp. M195]